MPTRYGIIQFQIDGEVYQAVGNFTYNVGGEDRETQMGADGLHGYSVQRQAAHIEGEIREHSTLDLNAVKHARNATVTLELAGGKTIVLADAFQVNEMDANTEEGNIPIRFEGEEAQEVT